MAWYHRLWNVLRPGRLQRDLERQLSFHVTERAEELLEDGVSKAEAARTARLQFGNFARQVEETRDMDINRLLESTVRNLRYAVRTLAKAPTFTITVIVTLALGIGANSAVFSAIDAVLLRPLPFPNGDALVEVAQIHAHPTGFRTYGESRHSEAQRRRIEDLDAKQLALYDTTDCEDCGKADQGAHHRERLGSAEDHAQYVGRVRAKRHPDADFAGALRDGIARGNRGPSTCFWP